MLTRSLGATDPSLLIEALLVRVRTRREVPRRDRACSGDRISRSWLQEPRPHGPLAPASAGTGGRPPDTCGPAEDPTPRVHGQGPPCPTPRGARAPPCAGSHPSG